MRKDGHSLHCVWREIKEVEPIDIHDCLKELGKEGTKCRHSRNGGEGVLDYGVPKEPTYVTWAGLTGREDTEPKAFSRVRMGLYVAWTASLVSGRLVSFLC